MVKTLLENNLKSRDWEMLEGMSQFDAQYKVYRKNDFLIILDDESDFENIAVYAYNNNSAEDEVEEIIEWISYDDMNSDKLLEYLILNY